MMKDSEYDVMFEVEDTHWWYTGMEKITRAVLNHVLTGNKDVRILDGGCGTGGVLNYLTEYGHVTAFDYSARALRFCKSRNHERLVQASTQNIPHPTATFDVVTSFDVLCTRGVLDDEIALAEYARVLKENGLLITRLPAYNWLRGRHDEMVEVVHRYTAGEIKDKLRRTGFEIEHLSYANMLLFPVAMFKRIAERILPPKQNGSDLTLNTSGINSILHSILGFEAPFVARTRLPFGLTIVTVARKR